MKLLLLLLPLLAATAMGFEIRHPVEVATYQGRSLASIVVDIMYYIRDQMPCGFPALNIPPLAPLEIKNKKISIQIDSVTVELEVKDFVLNGLDNFDVKTFKINPVLGRMNFEMLYDNVNITTWYHIKVASTGGIKFNFERQGNAALGIRYLSVAGESNYNLAINGGPVSMSTFFIFFNVAEVNSNIENLSEKPYMNKVLNDIVEEWISIAINDYSQEIAQLISDAVTGAFNRLVDGRTLEELIEALTGGSSDVRDLKADCKTAVRA